MRRTYFVTALAGDYVAGSHVAPMAPGPSGAVELDLTEAEAFAELLIGSLSDKPPEKAEESDPAPAPSRRRRKPPIA